MRHGSVDSTQVYDSRSADLFPVQTDGSDPDEAWRAIRQSLPLYELNTLHAYLAD